MVDALHQSKTIRFIYLCGKFFDSLSKEQRRLLFAAIQNLESLQAIYVANAKLSMEAVLDLADLVGSCKADIQELSFQHLEIPDTSVILDPLIYAAAQLRSLEKIELGILFIHHEGAVCTKESLERLCESPSLQALTLIDLRLDQDHLTRMAQRLTRNTTLQELHLWGEYVGSALYDIAKMVEGNRSIHTLSLYFASMEEKGVIALANSLGGSHASVKSLSIEHADDSIQRAGILAISHMLAKHQHLETFSLTSNALRGEGCEQLCQALSNHSSLKELTLDNACDVDGGSYPEDQNNVFVRSPEIEALAGILEANTVLERLDLSGMALGQSGVIALASALHHNSSLRELTLAASAGQETADFDSNSKDEGFIALIHLLEHNKVLGRIVVDSEDMSDFDSRTKFLLSLNYFKIRTMMVDINSTKESFLAILGERRYDISSLYYLLSMNPSFIQP